MYGKIQIKPRTSIERNESVEGETIENKIYRILYNGSDNDLKEKAPIFTKASDGVLPAHDIRSDKMELLVETTDRLNASKLAKRDSWHKENEEAQKRLKEEADRNGEAGQQASDEK